MLFESGGESRRGGVAEALVAEADTVCPYSHAVRGNIPVKLTVVDA